MPPKNKKQKTVRKTSESDLATSTGMSDVSAASTSALSVNQEREALRLMKKEELLAKLDAVAANRIMAIEQIGNSVLACLTSEQRATPVTLDSLADLAAIMDCAFLVNANPVQQKLLTPASARRRRSRSVERSAFRLASIEESPRPRRPSSVETFDRDTSALRTPVNSTGATARLMTASKYSVRRPLGQLHNPAVNVKRVMRANEEVLSTAGSPLFVQGRVPREPEVNIPLPDGMILNIDPENASKAPMIPQLDELTKRKIQALCDKLQKCIKD